MASSILSRERPFVSENFSESDATGKIGKKVRLLADYADIQKGSIGYIVDFHVSRDGICDIIIRWDLPNGAGVEHTRLSRTKYELFIKE